MAQRAKVLTSVEATRSSMPWLPGENPESAGPFRWHHLQRQLIHVDSKQAGCVDSLILQIDAVAQGAANAARQQAASGFRAWVRNACLQGAGAAHRWTNKEFRLRPLPDTFQDEEGTIWAEPHQVAVAREVSWMNLWSRDADSVAGLKAKLGDLRKRALEARSAPAAEPPRMQALSAQDVKRAIASIPSKSRVGVDQWSTGLWRHISEESVEGLVELFKEVERTLAWPPQVYFNYIALLSKPDGGERPIGLMPMLYRVWLRARRPALAEWEEARAGFWDTAVKGSSALQAGLRRALLDETSVALGEAAVTFLWDMAKFYDSIDLSRLLLWAERMDYPVELLILGMQLHVAPRCINVLGTTLPGVDPSNGIVAGCGQANAWARVVLYDVLEFVHRAAPQLGPLQYVDDLAQSARGSYRDVASQLPHAALMLKRELEEAKCTVSAKKCVLIASTPALGRKVARLCRALGVQVKYEAQARDLGLGTAGEGRRTAKVMNSRFNKGAKRCFRISRLARASSTASKLHRTGAFRVQALPQAKLLSCDQLRLCAPVL